MDTGVVTGVTRWMPLVDLEHLILQGHPSSHPIFGRVRIAQSLVFCVVFRRLLFVLFFWPLCWFALLRFAISDYPFLIINLFLHEINAPDVHVCI